jgi:hypothetical protein
MEQLRTTHFLGKPRKAFVMSVSFEDLMSIVNDENASTSEKRFAKALITAKGGGVAKKVADRFTTIDNNGAKAIAIRTPGVKGPPRKIAVADLPTTVADAKRVLADLEGALAFANEQGLL